MYRTATVLLLLALVLSACVPHHHLFVPPGQVMKATGIHPVSGKVKHHGHD